MKPKRPRYRKPVHKITDRAKRYRANHPSVKPKAKFCQRILPNGKVCGSRRNLVTAHLDGNESNLRKSNLATWCKSCNTKHGKKQARLGRGVRTRQYNGRGAKTLGEYVSAAVRHTRGAHDEAGKLLHETPKSKRREYADVIWRRRKGRGNPVPTRTRRKRNYAGAADLYKQFHGKESEFVTEYEVFEEDPFHNHPELGQLGKLVSLTVKPAIGDKYKIEWDEKEAPDLCGEPNGKQLYIVGGNQTLGSNIAEGDANKELLDLGECRQVEYFTRKGFDNFQAVTYYHKLGEETGETPRLLYDRKRKRLFFAGGAYRIKPEGIVN